MALFDAAMEELSANKCVTDTLIRSSDNQLHQVGLTQH